MNSQETVQALLDAIQKGDFENALSFLTSDFHFSGPMPEPFTAEQWFGMSADMKTAFPDLDYHFVVQNVDGSVVNTTHQLSGTHTGSFDLTAMGMSVFPATGKSFSLGQEPAQVIIRDGKIISYKIQITKGAGLMALLGQLGIKTPSM